MESSNQPMICDDVVPACVTQGLGQCSPSLAFCKGCKSPASLFQKMPSDPPHDIAKLYCRNEGCGCKVSFWFACLTCNQSFVRSNLKPHLKSKRHSASIALHSSHHSSSRTSTVRQPATCREPACVLPPTDCTALNNDDDIISIDMASSVHKYTTTAFLNENNWLADCFSHVPQAKVKQVNNAFGGNEAMSVFWVAELASPTNCCGGGAQHLVGQAFSEFTLLSKSQVPTIMESKWHILNFIQYQSLSEKQRQRQAQIQALTHRNHVFDSGICSTSGYAQQGRVFCSNSKHSIWNNLPIPVAEDFGGIAYVSPINILRFALANGVPINDCILDGSYFSTENIAARNKRKNGESDVFYISESLAYEENMTRIAEARKAAGILSEPIVVMESCSWRDGFSANGTKNNRESPLLWTYTTGNPKDKANAGDNTFTMAIGKKNNPNWKHVERQFHRDMEQLTNPLKPQLFFHGGIKKMVPVVLFELVAIEDKPERAAMTKTLDGGEFHQCYGKLVKVEEPVLDNGGIMKFLSQSSRGEVSSNWGWSEKYVSKVSNGGRFGSCYKCRLNRLVQLGMPNGHLIESDYTCNVCADWNLEEPSKSQLMSSPPPSRYPKEAADDACPIPFPVGREPGVKKLPVVNNLSFEFLLQACRVAYYHGSRTNGKGWNKGQVQAYLRTCGIKGDYAAEIATAAIRQREVDVDVDYDSKEGLGDSLQYPAPWFGGVKLHDYIETVMHQCFIGISQTNMEIIDNFMKSNKTPGLKWGVEPFRRGIQVLLQDLKSFGLSWLLIMPFNTNKKADETVSGHTTGSWQGENWLAFTRISCIVFSWILKDGKKGLQSGALDVSRMVVCYHAFISRLMTHSGMNISRIHECDMLIKEFLNCVSEVDIRGHYAPPSEAKKKGPAKGKSSKSKKAIPRKVPCRGTSNPQRKKRKAEKDGITLPKIQETALSRTKFKWSWQCQNFMSIFNLITMMERHGPLVNWWDGGGKCEKGIQQVKPLIQRGVPPYPKFFIHLMRRLYKARQMLYMENMYCPTEVMSSKTTIITMDHQIAIEEEIREMSVEEGCVDDAAIATLDYCDIENRLMSKARTTFTYKTRNRFFESVLCLKPLCGILVEDEGTGLNFYCIARITGESKLGWSKITFDDSMGTLINGLWYAPISASELSVEKCPKNLDEIKKIARMSGVAIPLWYVFGMEHPNAQKYCVITNWWKPRYRGDRYFMPSLDFNCYKEVADNINNDDGIDMDEDVYYNTNHVPILQASHHRVGSWRAPSQEVHETGFL